MVAQLSQLTCLCWNYSSVTDLGIERLTALRTLQGLYMYDNCGISRKLSQNCRLGAEDLELYETVSQVCIYVCAL